MTGGEQDRKVFAKTLIAELALLSVKQCIHT